jgi:hypothetical protein
MPGFGTCRMLIVGALAVLAGCATGGEASDDGTPVLDAAPGHSDSGGDGSAGPEGDASGDAVAPPEDGGGGGDGSALRSTRSARTLAAGGTVSTSAHYKAIRTLGQAPGGNGAGSSAKYTFHGGLVGATQ